MDHVARAKLLLFAQMTDEPAFDQLRSKEQLGYVVWSGARYAATTIGYRVIIQSERTAKYLESRIDAFLTDFGTQLENMSDKDFEGHKRSVINKRLEKLKNLSSEASRFWTHIGSEYFDFVQSETDAATVRTLTKSDLIEFYRQFIDPQSPTRGKLSVHMNAQGGAQPAATSSQERKSQLILGLAKQLETAGIAVDASRLETAFAKVDVSTGDKAQILSALNAFFVKDLSLPEEQAKPVLEQADRNLGFQLKHLGFESSADHNVENSVETTPQTNGATKPKPVTYITNVPEFKARLAVSAGPHPVTDLSEFEDFDAKL